jgi:cyclic dehypoxanthinyl futalosine synthase
MGSVMIEENVVRAAGASYCMDEVEIVRNIENAGYIAKRRNMQYEIIGEPIFRERHVPRMTTLAAVSANKERLFPPELSGYDARTPIGKRQRTLK